MFPSSLKYLKFIWPLHGWKPLHLWVPPRGSLWPVCLKMSKKLGRFYSGKVKNNKVCTTGFSFWIVKHYLFSFNYRAIMLLWNRACRFHYNFSLNWMFVNVKVSTMTCGMKQKHRFYINLILLFPPILSQSGFLDMLNLLQWFPWQLLFIVVPPRTPVIRKPNFARGLVFAFSPSSAAADPGGTAASSCPPHLPHSHTQRQGQEAHDGKLLRFYDYCYSWSSLSEPCSTSLATAAFPVNPHQKGEVLIAVHSQKFKMLSFLWFPNLQNSLSTKHSIICVVFSYMKQPLLYSTIPQL